MATRRMTQQEKDSFSQRLAERKAMLAKLRENAPPPKDLAFWRPDPKGIEGPVPAK